MQNTEAINRIDQLFDRLDDWKSLPSYQLERRADIFFAIYLKEILQTRFNIPIDFLIPEFPLRIESLTPGGNNTNLSNKVDYLAINLVQKRIFLVELKTEMNSLNPAQDEYLKKAKEKGLTRILFDLLDICSHSRQKSKYKHLFNYLEKIKWFNEKHQPIAESDYQFDIVYIIPSLNHSKVEKITNAEIITFDYIIEKISHHDDPLTQRFIKSLASWIPVSDKKIKP